MGSGACGRGSQPRSRATLDQASRRKIDAQGSFLASPGEPLAKALRPGREAGPQGRQDAAVERRKARPADRKAGRLLTKTAGIPGAPYGALLPHLREQKASAPQGAHGKPLRQRAEKPKSGLTSRGTPRREDGGACRAPGCLKTGSGKSARRESAAFYFSSWPGERSETRPSIEEKHGCPGQARA